MQYIKPEFELIKGAKNIVHSNSIKYTGVSNWYNKIFNIFNLLDNSFRHDSKKTITNLINNKSKTEKIFKVVVFNDTQAEYHLPGCYDESNKIQLINIGFFQIHDISISKPSAKELYAIVLYNYILYQIHSKKIKFNYDICQNIINYYTSLFMSMFGKQYGMTGIYTAKIPKLKFCISCYILASYFNLSGKKLYDEAQSQSTYHPQDTKELDKYDLSSVSDFVKLISDMEVFPGFNTYKLMGRFYTSFGISFLASFEDFGRFIAMTSTCVVSGNGIIPSFIYKYNKKAFDGIFKTSAIIYNK